MPNGTTDAAPISRTERIVSSAVVFAIAVYAAIFIDLYTTVVVLPFFALGCRRGKHPLKLWALASVPALAILVVSAVKFQLTGLPLVFEDHYFLRSNVLMLAYNDWRIAGGVIFGVIGTILYFRTLFRGQGAFSRIEAASLAALTALVATTFAIAKPFEQNVYNWNLAMTRPGIEALFLSANIPDAQLERLPAGAAVPAVDAASLTAPAGGLPDLFFILQESTFHPKLLRPGFEAKHLFAESQSQNGLTGPLRVHTFAGGTWRTEFSLATQMRPQEFGGDGLYVFHQLEGRIQRSLFTMLKELGYRTYVFYPTPTSFLNARNFYATIGVDEFHDPTTLGTGDGWDWQIPDSALYAAMEKKVSEHDGPVAALMLTIKQHGPHKFEDPMSEYVTDFNASDDAYGAFLKSREATGRRTGVVAFGDHHPEFTARFLDNKHDWYFTAYDMRCVNFACAPSTLVNDQNRGLDMVLLPTAALDSFGFGLDGFSAFELSLYRPCIADVTTCDNGTRLTVNTAFSRYFN